MVASMASPIGETYIEVEKLIYHTVNKFVARFGGDTEEYVAEANLVYMRVYEAYDPAKGAFSTLLVTSINNRLMDMSQSAYRKSKVHSSIDEHEIQPVDRHHDFRIGEFLEDLTADARMVVDLVLHDSPVSDAAAGKGGEIRNWQSSIREYLRGLGWSARKIGSVFSEVSAALA